MPSRRIAIIGAGPVGLEAALYGAALGHDVQVYERGRIAENVRAWGHVTLFSEWKLNHSALGAQLPASSEGPSIDPERYLTGNEHVALYLEPLSRCPMLEGRIHEGAGVLHIGRETIGKRDGGPRREHPFRLLIDRAGEERIVSADVVLDCSGTYGHHDWLGSGNVPALGERRLRRRIDYTLRDIAGTEREAFTGARVLLAGNGYSAAAALEALVELPETEVLWIARRDSPSPYRPIPNDPLPQRAALAALGNRIAGGAESRVRYLPATTVQEVAEADTGFRVTLRSACGDSTVEVDRILAHVGYSPDNSIYRELQVHECYASFGPMRLAATLLEHDSEDCLAQTSAGPDALKNPEPDFFILGAKSYGKNSSFLIRLGLEQVRDVYTLINDKPDLNLYAA